MDSVLFQNLLLVLLIGSFLLFVVCVLCTAAFSDRGLCCRNDDVNRATTEPLAPAAIENIACGISSGLIRNTNQLEYCHNFASGLASKFLSNVNENGNQRAINVFLDQNGLLPVEDLREAGRRCVEVADAQSSSPFSRASTAASCLELELAGAETKLIFETGIYAAVFLLPFSKLFIEIIKINEQILRF
ncbi:unnamed protein product [Gongylonema pulchrum]|uniref:Uncharacterized protein n=1 Tax=Gongylonema pulchrum TaxID=637853 RepID=A0A183CUZ5_9BILA|nr:unnamed protein product [Gongylonema pulchrum]